jgi:hypothetical protein
MAFNLDNYETVEDRLVRFWNDHPNGRIFTDGALRRQQSRVQDIHLL